MSYRFVVAFVVLLVVSLPAGVAGIGSAGSGSSSTAASTEFGAAGASEVAFESRSATPTATGDDVLHRTTTLRHLPAQPGTFETEMTFAVPDPVEELEIELEAAATVESTAGFEATDDGTYRWTETTDEPSVRFTMPADRRGDDGDVAGARSLSNTSMSSSDVPASDGIARSASASSEGYTFVDTGDWGIVQVPGVGISLRQTESVGLEETVTVDGPGATGGDVAFFGPVTEYERTAGDDGELIRLAVPDAATVREEPDDILETLADASERLDVGASSDEVFVVAAPTDVDWGPEGVQYGESDAWVVADASLSDPSNVWLHEYVHARQRFTDPSVGTATEAAWLGEAQADYYAGLLALEQGLIDFETFERYLADGERDPYADGVLRDPDTWTDERTDYVKGRLVAGELDRQLRVATDGDRTLEDVIRVLNARDEQVTEAALLDALEDAGGQEVRTAAERYTGTTATPEPWSRTDHEDAFDRPVAEFAYGIETESITVGGDSWPVWERDRDREQDHDTNKSPDQDGNPTERLLAVPAEEPVSVPVTVDNVGDRDGTYDATLQVDGETVDYAQARLEAGDETDETLAWTPSEPGTYELRVGSDRLPVAVRGGSSVSVTDLALESEDVAPGEPVTATATVAAAGEEPGAAVLEFRTPDDTSEVPVAVRAGETATVETELTFDGEGRYEVAVRNQSATVSVGHTSPADLEAVPGFDALTAVVALLAVLVSVMWMRRR